MKVKKNSKKVKPVRRVSRERIPEALVLDWKVRKQSGDVQLMADALDLPYSTVSYAIRGFATPGVWRKVERWMDKNRPALAAATV